MATKERIKTRCPLCRSKYMVPTTLVGHRARCAKCKATFRVAEHNGHPTEDDIVRWLNEGMDEYELANRPRIISGGSPSDSSSETGDDKRPESASTPRLNSNRFAAGLDTAPHPQH